METNTIDKMEDINRPIKSKPITQKQRGCNCNDVLGSSE